MKLSSPVQQHLSPWKVNSQEIVIISNPKKDSKPLFRLIAKVLMTCLLLWWFIILLTVRPFPWIFLDFANFPIHEAGHFLFIFFGQFLYTFGGTFFQILVPLFVTGYFFFRSQWYSSVFSLFWLGDVLVNISFYIADARTQELPLAIPGALHDWNWLLGQMGWLPYDHFLGGSVYWLGILVLSSSLIFGFVNVWNEAKPFLGITSNIVERNLKEEV